MNLHEMDKLHTSMVRQMEEAEMMDQAEVGGISQRKTSVSAACQTDKVTDEAKIFYICLRITLQVSRKVSRVSKFVSDEHVPSRVPAPRHSRVSQIVTRVDTEDKEMTPVTRVVTTGIREVKEKEARELKEKETRELKEKEAREVKEKESRVTMSETQGMSNLRKYNNILVSFIEKARVLSEAEEINNSYPSSLYEFLKSFLDPSNLIHLL